MLKSFSETIPGTCTNYYICTHTCGLLELKSFHESNPLFSSILITWQTLVGHDKTKKNANIMITSITNSVYNVFRMTTMTSGHSHTTGVAAIWLVSFTVFVMAESPDHIPTFPVLQAKGTHYDVGFAMVSIVLPKQMYTCMYLYCHVY